MRNQNNLRNKKQNVIFDSGKIIEINDKDMPQSKKIKSELFISILKLTTLQYRPNASLHARLVPRFFKSCNPQKC
ncbi:TPA: hypothetical protein VB881_001217 [Streptococcus suis]|nr:hypothetical protein [Streptococcus suis]HEM5155434.1 hypothetical protein [Streptococcus suis]HEM5182980.1 hypothetical protein [Streptococcus suis]HEP1794577.1 hypothetical protein [Streptococcus suis]